MQRTLDGLLTEYRALLDRELPLALARKQGILRFHLLKARVDSLSEDTGVRWVLQAHIGTLEKLRVLLPTDREPSTLELLAAARNLFENLVWLKLFLLDASWGEFFYGQLLANQNDDIKGMISKLRAEADLFDELENEDNRIIDEVYHDVGRLAESSQIEIEARRTEHKRRERELDDRARKTFALYASSATSNGYGFQAHLLREQIIPEWQTRLRTIQDRVDRFKQDVGDATRSDRYLGKWNWRDGAQRVQMVSQYDFLYRLTSRLLHSTPMNIVTEKELLEPEKIVMLEFLIVSVRDVFDDMMRFTFPGMVDAVSIEMET